MTHGVYAAMNTTKPTRLHQAPDRVTTQAAPKKLLVSDQSTLAISERHDRRDEISRQSAHILDLAAPSTMTPGSVPHNSTNPDLAAPDTSMSRIRAQNNTASRDLTTLRRPTPSMPARFSTAVTEAAHI